MIKMMDFYKTFLPLAAILYVLLVFVLRSVILWKQAGINPFVFVKAAHDNEGGGDHLTFEVKVATSGIRMTVL
jgi:hypothetical protein